MTGLLRKLLVVVNGAESSISAVKFAIALQRDLGSRILAVYVVDTQAIRQLAMSRIFVDEESEEYFRSLLETGRRYLLYAEELARQKGGTLSSRLLQGSVSSEAIHFAEQEGVDAILVGGWERSSTIRDILAEENREIARTARCPVLIVRGAGAENAYDSL
ncbi:MAG TPA: universal stress protein [Rectinemataceae bacterium]|nr:universal stress protein [Rectinemataceae bacterium]